MFDLQRRLDQMDEGSCAFYWDPNNRPLPPNRETSPGLSKDNLDRLAKEIGDVRADIADPADRAAFDRDVTEPFRRARAKFEEATTR